MIPARFDFFDRHQVGGFYQTAKIFFTDVMLDSFAGGETFDGFVFHFQSFEVNDPQIFIAEFPDLALLKFDLGRHE